MDRHLFVASRSATSGNSAPADPALPEGCHVRYFRPTPALAAAITGYNCYAEVAEEPRTTRFLPAHVMICVSVDSGAVSVAIGRHRFEGLARSSLYGATTRPLHVTSRGGLTVGIGISPVGWARLGGRRAADFHNRVVALDRVLPTPFVARLERALAAIDDVEAIPTTLDAILTPLLSTPHPQERLIHAFGALIVRDGDVDIVTAAATLGISTAALRRLALRFFGMPPKLLLRRARFLRSFLRDNALDGSDRRGAIDPSYYDQSHYLRDASTFLGATPRRFLAQPNAFLLASIRARAAALGAATQALHRPFDQETME